jgi:D-alanyl-D-alanine dipeptidase
MSFFLATKTRSHKGYIHALCLCAFVANIILYSPLLAQTNYGIHPLTYDEYKKAVAANPEKELINLQKFVPGIVLDIKYATPDNFTHEKVYTLAKAFARKPVAEALKKVQAKLKPMGLGIKIYDAYRPWSATVKFFELMKGDTMYVASPYKGSRHNRGCALDMTLINLKTGKELTMPTEYDAMQKESWPSTPVNDPDIRKNRETLINIMESNGFTVYITEWWHFDFKDWNKFEVMNIDFEKLEK